MPQGLESAHKTEASHKQLSGALKMEDEKLKQQLEDLRKELQLKVRWCSETQRCTYINAVSTYYDLILCNVIGSLVSRPCWDVCIIVV